jgi:hypothetical protein
MTDEQLLAGFEACTLESFHHTDHVRVAWIILRRMPLPDAVSHFTASLQRFAAAAGAPQKYDDGLTRRYLALIDERIRGETSWEEFARRNPSLLVWPPAVGARSSAPDILVP